MNKKRKSNKYLELALILLGVILLVLGASNLYKHRQESKINSGYLSKYIASVQYNELDSVMLELNSDTFFYISYTGELEIHNLEVKLKRILDDHELIDNMIYLNVTDLLEEENYLDKINESLNLEDTKIEKLPAIIYFKDNELVKILDSKLALLKSTDFYRLLEQYEIIKEDI